MSKHTPGPWMAIGDGAGGADIVNSDGLVVKIIFASSNKERQNADALLIKSAPLLLAALRSALPLLRGHQETPKKVERYEAALTAIDKATGGNP